MTVLKNEASDNKVEEGTAETPIVTMETPNTTACGKLHGFLYNSVYKCLMIVNNE